MTIEKNQRALAQLSALYRPGTLNLIGGRPGMGKTTLAFQLATEAQLPTATIITTSGTANGARWRYWRQNVRTEMLETFN